MTKGTVPAPISDIRIRRNVLIPTRDGVELAADVFLPKGDGPFPVIVGYHPYRKDDYSAGPGTKDQYFIAEGYGTVQIDIRGTGSSRGSTSKMFRQQEWEDGYDAVEWIAAQPWCNGNVGMTGESYGGFSSLLVAAEQPPHLKAIVPIFLSPDFYDANHPGGNPQMTSHPMYGSMMLALNALPPLADSDGEWIEAWEHKLEHNSSWLVRSLRHPRDGSDWDSGSANRRFGAVRCPTYVMGGWHDVFISEPFQVFMGISPDVPCKLLMGPYMHISPWTGVPGPQVHHMHEIIRWFDQFLKDEETGITDEPPIRLFVREYDVPSISRDTESGSWRFEEEWPPKRANTSTYALQSGGLLSIDTDNAEEGNDSYPYDPSAGLTTLGFITGFAQDLGLPLDQRAEEPKSLVYTTAPLTENLEVSGFPSALLYVSSTATEANFVARLCDVAPDGSSLLVSKGMLNTAHRDSSSNPERVEPGSVYALEFDLSAVSYVFPVGHRIRLLIASSDFPAVWPTPHPAVNTIHRGAATMSRIELPIVAAQSPPLPAPVFAKLPPLPVGHDPTERPVWQVIHDLVNESVEMVIEFQEFIDAGDGTQLTNSFAADIRTSLANPANSSVRTSLTADLINPTLTTRSHAQTTIQATEEVFHTTTSLELEVNGQPHFHRRWVDTTPRHLTD